MLNNLVLPIIFCILTINIVLLAYNIFLYNKLNKSLKIETAQYNMLIKIMDILKKKNIVNDTANKAEIIYQDLLQNLIPIMAAIEVMPRQTSEHQLWRALGGILDEYAKNPFVLEKLRRKIKLDSKIKNNVSNYLNRANMFLQHISATDADGILSTTFTDGLLGQSLTFFAQAQTLANNVDLHNTSGNTGSINE